MVVTSMRGVSLVLVLMLLIWTLAFINIVIVIGIIHGISLELLSLRWILLISLTPYIKISMVAGIIHGATLVLFSL